MAEPLVRVESLRVTYPAGRGGDPSVVAVSDVCIDLHESEVVAIVGESGSGKSTLVHTVAGLLAPTAVPSGVVRLGVERDQQVDVLGLSKKQLGRIRGGVVGFVPQNTSGALNPVVSIRRQFELTLARDGLRRAERRERAHVALADAGVRDIQAVWEAYPHELSGGLAQRVVFALALCRDPRILLADEPTTALDPVVQADVLGRLRARITESATGALLVTHDLGVAAEYADRVVVMRFGEDVESGPTDSVIADPHHPYTRRLVRAGMARGPELLSRPTDDDLAAVDRSGTQVAVRPGWLQVGEDHRVREAEPRADEGPDHFDARETSLA